MAATVVSIIKASMRSEICVTPAEKESVLLNLDIWLEL